ncbi:metalloregulator ArsR/SmtB family transcription factor [Mesorhizobium sp.]|uniref:ArsR/SmtB family transcription factor n=1 Tax=Mesorhizobium sp. TaxID=1871066 RepID=UPI000FE814FC|nr:metalloregulator ArsR/SmtB family transcription factor [Mesorhizobium sp.]RWM31827.1 MAG: ArsR family transcriptional regulator [Mesorhizobium sp.]RWM39701.1 MAG: ArsR family transcriptional regulator [Mesorhizobium sp.]TIO77360.1 MAG: winged helix-turn-helix transcriptional regulator [Mesorhizobium sp.]TIO86206.1 MAG: winged helix-turn-helix transcriptional regulator [Mesorhizobium sp.]
MISLETASPSVPPIDGIFRALADPTRRRVVERLNRSSASVSELAEPFEMALPSFVEHLKVLEGCGLVQSEKAGRVRTYRLSPEPLKLAEDWLAEQRALWERRLDQFDAYVMSLKETEK